MSEKIGVSYLPKDIIEDGVYVINQSNPNSYTHNYFKYPCKFIPEIPRWAMNTFLDNSKKNKVLDPFSGSGTSLLEAALQGYDSYGGEIDEVAKLITKVKTTKLNEKEMNYVVSKVSEIIKKLERHEYLDSEIVLPQINNLNHWFKEDVLEKMGYIYYSISQIDDIDVQEFMLVSMASIVKRVSNCDDISPKPYVSNKVEKKIPSVEKLFQDTILKNIESMKLLQEETLGSVQITGDALKQNLEDESIDLAVTSPPYINAFDYVRTLRLENLWLKKATEDSLRQKKKKYLGTESINTKKEREDLSILTKSELLSSYFSAISSVDEKRALIVKKFFEDMEKNLLEVYRVLKKGSKYVIVIGNSNIRKNEIESWKILKDLAIKNGFNYVTHFGYEIKNPYIRIPRGKKGGKIAIDQILVLEKG